MAFPTFPREYESHEWTVKSCSLASFCWPLAKCNTQQQQMVVPPGFPHSSAAFVVDDDASSSSAAHLQQQQQQPLLSLPACPGFCGWWPPPEAMSLHNTTVVAPSGDPFDLDNIALGTDTNADLVFAYCKPCPWGMRSGGLRSPLCRPCETALRPYDYLFLLFHALAPFLLNSAAIGYYSAARLRLNQRRLLWVLLQTVCALLESSLGLIGALLIFPPIGELWIVGCERDRSLKEWYSMLNNPVLDYTRVLHCASELVYPLYSLPFAIYAINLAALLLLRPFLYAASALSNGGRNLLPGAAFYAALWALPLLALGHSILSGILYALFPFIALSVALLQLVVHLSAQASPQAQLSGRGGSTVHGLARRVLLSHCCYFPGRRPMSASAASFSVPFSFSSPLWLPLLIHLGLFAYALFSMAVAFGAPVTGQLDELTARFGWWPLVLTFVGLLPLPTLFYILTVRLSAPGGMALAHR